jgi:hypothetical protein
MDVVEIFSVVEKTPFFAFFDWFFC